MTYPLSIALAGLPVWQAFPGAARTVSAPRVKFFVRIALAGPVP
ncbi:hypothetical protein X737_28910 [Mesorhizobium sp. L48C026A00]|nr:hypothetical protein X737_28910 [Mesorhizobium sp. L48C026A00]